MQAELARAQALLSKKQPNPDKAIKTLRPLLKRNHRSWMLYHYMGVAMLQKGDHKKGLEYMLKALDEGSKEPETFHLVSVSYHNLCEFELAIKYANEAINRKRDFLEAWINLGAAHRALANLDESMKAYSEANRLDPKNAGIAYRIGSIYFDQGDLKKARELYKITAKMEPDSIEAYLGQALIHLKIQEFPEAVDKINEALKIDPNNRLSRIQLAVAYKDWGKYTEAIQLNEQLLREKPNDGRLRVNYALCLLEVGRFNEAERNYLRALKDSPDAPESLSNYLMGIHYNPERTKDEIYDAHLLWDQHFAPKTRNARPVPENLERDKKLRVGFISGGFRKHPVGWMITRAIENLPKDQIEVYGYTTHSMYDSLTMRIRKRCDKWTSVLGYTDKVVAKILQEDEIDILVELSGHSAFNRLKTVALEPVPITIKWVGGLFNTTGMETMDYLLTDQFESPEGEEEYYTEKLVRMPNDYVCYEPPEYNIPVGPLPALENGAITFGCFNNPSKLNDQLIAQWSDILHQVPGSRLFLKSKQYDTDEFVQHVIDLFAGFDIPKERLIFEGYAMHEDLLAAYNQIDIALDPWPYSGGLTTCEALWMGVPVVTCAGPTFAGRHSVTHLNNSGNADWVTYSWDAYKNRVIELASDLAELSSIRKNLREKLLASSLCDGARFGAHLTQAFRTMWHQRVDGYNNDLAEGEWQDHINVEPLSELELDEFIVKHDLSREAPYLTTYKEIELGDHLKVALPKSTENLSHFKLIENPTQNERLCTVLNKILEDGDSVVEIGAGYGVLSTSVANKIESHGTLLSYEPNAEIFQYLQETRRLNRFRQWNIINKAITDSVGQSYLAVGSIEEHGFLNEETGTEQVETTSLDFELTNSSIEHLKLLVIDSLTNLDEIFAGSEKTLDAHQPQICMGNHSEDKSDLFNKLSDLGYQIYEHIEEVGVLSALELDQESTARWLFALTPDCVRALSDSGFIFNGDDEFAVTECKYLKDVIHQDWANSFVPNWIEAPESEAESNFFHAVNLLWTVDQNDELTPSVKANLSVEAASLLLDLYTANPGNLPVTTSLSRAFVNIGKQKDAASILKNLFEQVMAVNSLIDLSLPFLLPLKAQEEGKISSDGLNWLKVKVAEAWLLLQHSSAYFLEAKELKFLKRLSGNPDALPIIQIITDELLADGEIEKVAPPVRLNGGKFVHIVFNHVYAKSLLDLSELMNEKSDQEHVLLLEKHTAIENYFVNVNDHPIITSFDYQHDLNRIKNLCVASDVDGVFFHGLFLDWQKRILKYVSTKKHVGWFIWGGDLYNPIKFGRPFRYLAGFVDSLFTAVEGDFNLFKEFYGSRNLFEFAYPYAGLYGEKTVTEEKVSPPTIIVGNSGDKGNNHLEVLNKLATKKDISDYQLLLPVAYNFSEEYEAELISGIEQLGLMEQTTLLKEFMAPEEYIDIVASASVFIGAHNRQQAIGNLLGSFYGGNKTLIRKIISVNNKEIENPLWTFLTIKGFQLQDVSDLESIHAISELNEVSVDQKLIHQNIINNEFGIEKRADQVIAACRQILANDKKVEPILVESNL